MSDVEFFNEEDQDETLQRPAAHSYSESAQWLVRNGYVKSESTAKAVLISLSIIFFAISFVLMYIASSYVEFGQTLESINL